MHRLIPAILEAWRVAERDLADEPPFTQEAARLRVRIDVLERANAMALAHGTHEDVAAFLQEQGAGDVVTAARDQVNPEARSDA